ncbi:uncharacterized protein LOC110458257 [Mizuhopecten yessoensis]|uniref:uncharacterized protein LOC110458257 n=1 Tax=Mizuhopecten yessoensis TaxID=6573 RepID=UPI000B45C279|nr:uncharacterized protein LOC110458257 [Mizuhopecten yessoensis]
MPPKKTRSRKILAATPSKWPAEVTNPPNVMYSMDRPWVQEQFPQMNITCPPPITGNQPQQSTSFAELHDISSSQMLASDSFSSLLGQIRQSQDDNKNRQDQ